VHSAATKKERLRRHVAELVAETPPAQRAEWDRAIQARMLADAIYRRAKVIHCYLALSDEVAMERVVRAALADGKRLVVPVMAPQDRELMHVEIANYDRELVAGKWGILEPKSGVGLTVDPSEVDLFIVPGAAFDLRGYRLGRGLGYYDRCLSRVKGRAVICAVAYELQVLETVPDEPHDVPVDYIMTEQRVIECRSH